MTYHATTPLAGDGPPVGEEDTPMVVPVPLPLVSQTHATLRHSHVRPNIATIRPGRWYHVTVEEYRFPTDDPLFAGREMLSVVRAHVLYAAPLARARDQRVLTARNHVARRAARRARRRAARRAQALADPQRRETITP